MSLCLRCDRGASADVDLAPGLPVGMCEEHAAEWRAAVERRGVGGPAAPESRPSSVGQEG